MTTRLNSNALLALFVTLLLYGGSPPESPVADAAMRGDAEAVRALLRSGADVNAAQGDGMTALHWAAERGDVEMAEVVLAAGANPSALTRLGDYTPLHAAAKSGSVGVARALLNAGAEAEARTSTGGATPLHLASGAGHVEVVEALLEQGVEVDSKEPMWLQTPLMFASAGGHTSVVRALLAAGADPAITARVMDMDAREQQDREDRRRQEDAQARIRAAVEGAPAPRARSGGGGGGRPATEDLNNQQRDRVPSSRYSHAQLVGGYGGLAALHLAVREGHASTVRALLEGGADIDQRSDGDGSAPLLMATINGNFDLAMELLERGADPNTASDANATALYTVINTQWIPKARHPQPANYMQQQVTYVDLVRVLLEAGVDPNVRLDRQLWFTTFGDDYLRVDRMGATPFWRAAYALDVPVMKLLIEYGADPDIPTLKTAPQRGGGGASAEGSDPSGLPPVPVGGPGAYAIHAASGIGYGEGFAANIHRVVPDGWMPAMRYLVEELGADVNMRDQNGYTPLHHAAARGDEEMIRYLVERGGDVKAVARTGQTTVDMANGPVQRISPFPSTIALLESLGAVNNHRCVSC
jgi:ankyrin repeat protein